MIGVVAVGVVQIAPHDTAIDLTSGETRAPAVDKIAAAKPNAEVPVARQEAAAQGAVGGQVEGHDAQLAHLDDLAGVDALDRHPVEARHRRMADQHHIAGGQY